MTIVPTQFNATQLRCGVAVWATQRSDPDFTPIDSISVLDLLLGYNNVAIVKEKKKLNKEEKKRFSGEVCFGERPNAKIMAFSGKWRCRAVSIRPTRVPDFYDAFPKNDAP